MNAKFFSLFSTRYSLLIWTVIRVLMGLFLAFGGFAKLLAPAENFEAALLKYGVFSPALIPWIARTLPWVEWLLGSFLIAGYAPRLSAMGATLLSLGFLVTLGSSQLFLESGGVDCGCFGESGIHLSVRQIFFVDLAIFSASLRLACLKEHPWSLHQILMKGRV